MAMARPPEAFVGTRYVLDAGRESDAPGWWARLLSRWSHVAAIAAAALFTTLVVFIRPFDVAYRSWTLHVAIQTVAAVVCTLAAYLFAGRYRLGERLSDLLVALSLLVLAVGGLCFSLLPAALDGGSITRFSTWTPVVTDVLGAAGFSAAAFAHRRFPLNRKALGATTIGFVALLVLIALAFWFVAARLPTAIAPQLSPVQGGRRLLVGRPAILALQLVSVLLLAISSFGFWRRRRGGDDLMVMLSTATALGSFAAFNYFLFPSLYSQWVYSGDILRMSFYLAILAAVAHELNVYWRNLAQVATLEERRRIARELHDGLSQELAFIANRSMLIRGTVAAELSSAAERALQESRSAIDALTRPLDEPLGISVRRAAEEVAIRFGVALALEMEGGVMASAEVRDALQRITREAALNAARHGRARHLTVSLARVGTETVVRISDDGVGFEPSQPSHGFGLISMNERATRVNGRLKIHSSPGNGTTVEVAV